MFASALGIRFYLWLGQAVPAPAPPDALESLTRIEVTQDESGADGFQLAFSLTRRSPLDFEALNVWPLGPMTRAVIGVLMGALPIPLIDGVITHSQIGAGSAPGSATLTVTGKDLTVLMDQEEKNESFPNQPDFVIASQILARYARYGIIPSPTPTADFPIMLERIPRQAETDLKFLHRLAGRNGYKFYLEPVAPGVTRAHWGPQVRAGLPQPALTQDMGNWSNVKSLNFAGDSQAAVGSKGVFVEPITKLAIPIPQLPSLKLPPLAARPSTPLRTTLQRETANKNPASAAVELLAETTNAADSHTAEGEVDGVRYGRVLRARGIVGVRGCGLTHDGFWLVRKVTHVITRNDYSQRFSLSREGTVSFTPVVVP